MATFKCPECGKLSARRNFLTTHTCAMKSLVCRKRDAKQKNYEQMVDALDCLVGGVL